MKTVNTVRVVLLIALACGCAPIQHEEKLTSASTSGVAGVGDLIARVDKERNLQNAFGASDIFGRKTKEGYSELRFAGVDGQGQAVLFRTDTNIETNETTMSRTPFSTTVAQANVNGNSVNVIGTTIHPTTDYHVIIPAGSVEIAVPKGTTSIPFSGHIINLIAVTPTSLTYRVD